MKSVELKCKEFNNKTNKIINDFKLKKMTNTEKIKQAEQLIREVLINEVEIINGNETSLKIMSKDVVDTIVNHWYLYREPEIFMSEDGEEIDEFLNVEEYKY